jgi:hypothetical protein
LLQPRAITANGIGRASAPEELDKASRAVAGAHIVDLADDVSSQKLTAIKALRYCNVLSCRASIPVARNP